MYGSGNYRTFLPPGRFGVLPGCQTSPVLRNVAELINYSKCSAGAAKYSPYTVHDCQWHPAGPLPAATPRELLAIAEAEIGCALPSIRQMFDSLHRLRMCVDCHASHNIVCWLRNFYRCCGMW